MLHGNASYLLPFLKEIKEKQVTYIETQATEAQDSFNIQWKFFIHNMYRFLRFRYSFQFKEKGTIKVLN